MANIIDVTGQRFGRLTVIEQGEYHISKSGGKTVQWKCLCDCGKICLINSSRLRSGKTKSCGCYHKEVTQKALWERNKKYNTYEEHGDYMTGFTLRGEKFYIDTSDYEKVKDICWYVARNGYIKGMIGRTSVFLHRFLMQPPDGKFVDHINHQHEDNRRKNLRIVSHWENMKNVKTDRKNNTSGCVGVGWMKQRNRWGARIQVNGKTRYVGFFKNFDDAVLARKTAEEKYYGEFSFDNSMAIAEENGIVV